VIKLSSEGADNDLENDYIKDREDVMGDLTQTGMEKTAEQILIDLQNLDVNIDAKTEIPNPLGLTAIQLLKQRYENLGFKVSESFVYSFIYVYKRNMVSKDRASRKEIIDAIIGMFERRTTKLSFSEKFTSNLKDL
jgi:hypothetical protein